jgi:hypothetical protein
MRAPALLSLLLLTVVAAAPSIGHVGGTEDGLSFTLRNALRAPTSAGNRLLLLEGQHAQGRTRLDILGTSGTGNEVAVDEYILLTDSTSVAVIERDRAWTPKPIETGTITTMLRSAGTGRGIREFAISVDSLGQGEEIDGRLTRRYRVTIDYVLDQDAGPQATHAVYDYWLADLPAPLRNPFDGRVRPTAAQAEAMGAAATQLNAAWDRLGPGTVVRLVANTVVGHGSPRPQPYVRTVELSKVRTAPVDMATLAIPSGFRRRGGG